MDGIFHGQLFHGQLGRGGERLENHRGHMLAERPGALRCVVDIRRLLHLGHGLGEGKEGIGLDSSHLGNRLGSRRVVAAGIARHTPRRPLGDRRRLSPDHHLSLLLDPLGKLRDVGLPGQRLTGRQVVADRDRGADMLCSSKQLGIA